MQYVMLIGRDPSHDNDLSELGKFDLVIEAAGNAQLMAQTLGLLRRSGVACLLGIDPRVQKVELDGRVLGVDTILEKYVPAEELSEVRLHCSSSVHHSGAVK